MFACATWNINNKMSNEITAAEMQFYRLMVCIFYTDRINNVHELKLLSTNCY